MDNITINSSSSSQPTGFPESSTDIAPLGIGKTSNQKYPIVAISMIISSAFCERLFYTGIKTLLVLFLVDVLHYNEDFSTTLYHSYAQAVYTAAVVGAILADTLLDKYKTIIRFSIIYVIGGVLLLISSFPDIISQNWSTAAFTLIAIGAGGLQPCVSAFGGEQFVQPQQDEKIEEFFPLLHYVMTVGALIATLSVPFLRLVKCYDQEFCYPLAFGLPSIFIILSFVTYFAGSNYYVIKPGQGKVLKRIIKCILHALRRKRRYKNEKHEHWLDYASDKYEQEFIDIIKQCLRMFRLLIPIPMYWALFEQQGSRWIFQASRMDGSLGSATIQPEQMFIISPFMILFLVPLMDKFIFPLLNKNGLFLTPLKKIGFGGFLAALAFVIAGIVELNVEPTYAPVPKEGATSLNFINTLPCQVDITFKSETHSFTIAINSTSYHLEEHLDGEEVFYLKAELINPICGSLNITEPTWSGVAEGAGGKQFSVVITQREGNLEASRLENEDPLNKSPRANPRIGFIFDSTNGSSAEISILLKSGDLSYEFISLNSSSELEGLVQTENREIESSSYDLFVLGQQISLGSIMVDRGGCYLGVIQQRNTTEYQFRMIQITPSGTVHMLWLVPQYFFLTTAEILFAASGMQFSFLESPTRARTLMQASWLFTGSLGNLIVVAVAETRSIPRQAMESFLFAGLMGINLILFIFLTSCYTYVHAAHHSPTL